MATCFGEAWGAVPGPRDRHLNPGTDSSCPHRSPRSSAPAGSTPTTGVTNPLGGINQLFPLFGIANQLLAAVALSLATTLLIKYGKIRWVWISAIPLAWDATVTLTASFQKVFSSDHLSRLFYTRLTAKWGKSGEKRGTPRGERNGRDSGSVVPR